MRNNGNIWSIASKDLQDQGIAKPSGPQITAEASRLVKRNGITDADVVDVLHPIDTTPDSWLRHRGTQWSPK